MITEQLARFVTETRLSDIPGEMLIHAQDALMDTVGCALAGAVEPVAEIALTWLNELGARPQATVWGQTVATSPAEAAFANGISAHALDFDDSLPTPRGHPSATMVPAALAVAEIAGSSGAEVLAAYATWGSKSAASLGARWGTAITLCVAGTARRLSARSPRPRSPRG